MSQSQGHSSSIKRALLSVSDKTGIVELAHQLHDWGIELLSTGGTARLLGEAGIPVVEVSRYTGFPEMMGGRVKTLHPKVHGGILGRRGTDDAVMDELSIPPIDLVVVNLYPFAKAVAQPNCSLHDAIENIDIGGPAMVRSSAKNHAAVTIVVNPADYIRVLSEMRENAQSVLPETRFQLAATAFAHTANYDQMIATYLSTQTEKNTESAMGTPEDERFPSLLKLEFERVQPLRYGENPHQQAAFYRESQRADALDGSITQAFQIQGKALSYNNIADTDAALNCVQQFAEPACVIVKHANPCGVALSGDLLSAYDRAYATDPESAFGGIIAFNQELDGATAKAIIDRQFVEVIIAPAVSEAARDFISEKPTIRLLECGTSVDQKAWLDFKRITGGFLVQEADQALNDKLVVVSKRTPTETEMADLQFAWKVAKFVKSNAIIYASEGMTIGVGAGQMSRVNSARIAAIKAGHAGLKIAGSVMASDAFFPFRDGIDNAAEAGIRAVIQPGGSMRDNQVITAADEHNMAMVFTGMRHFRH